MITVHSHHRRRSLNKRKLVDTETTTACTLMSDSNFDYYSLDNSNKFNLWPCRATILLLCLYNNYVISWCFYCTIDLLSLSVWMKSLFYFLLHWLLSMLVFLGDALASSQALQWDILHRSDASAGSGFLWVFQGLIQTNTTWRKLVLEECTPAYLDRSWELHQILQIIVHNITSLVALNLLSNNYYLPSKGIKSWNLAQS